jgi:hypothetical protein
MGAKIFSALMNRGESGLVQSPTVLGRIGLDSGIFSAGLLNMAETRKITDRQKESGQSNFD